MVKQICLILLLCFVTRGAHAEEKAAFVSMQVAGVMQTESGEAVILTDAKKVRYLPIFIGGTEALSIQLRLEDRRFERPLTHDLFDAMLKELGGELIKVQIHALKKSTFIARVFVRRAGRTITLDARPSDSIALALGKKIPIFVAAEVLQRAGLDVLEDGPRGPHGAGRIQEL